MENSVDVIRVGYAIKRNGHMLSAWERTLVRVVAVPFALCLAARAQCLANTIIVKGRVEHATAETEYRVRVQLVFPKHKPGESGEVTFENGRFHLPVEFVTEQSSLFTNLPKRCGRKPQTVVITLLHGEQKADEVSVDFSRDFTMADTSAYTLRSELVLKGESQ